MDPSPPRTETAAAAAYCVGTRALLAGRFGTAEAAFGEAVARDAAFTLGHAALAVARAELHPPGDPDDPSLVAAVRHARGTTRRARQHVAIVRLVLDGALARAAALAREHLSEYPDDRVILHLVTRRCADVDDLVG